MTTPTLTAAICTRDRPTLLSRALASLLRSEPALTEILVVDNAPATDETRRVVQGVDAPVRYVREPVPGLDFARNRALAEASGEIVAFLDDDAVAAPGWAAAFVTAFAADSRLCACTGRVEPLAIAAEAQRLFEANGGFSRGSRRIDLPRDARARLHGRRAPLIAWAVSVGSGCSMAVRRRPALELGGFDPALDLGAALPGGGDLDFFWRTLRSGGGLAYEPAARAWHEHRTDLPSLEAQLAGHQRALVAFLYKSLRYGPMRSRLEVALFLAWRLMKPGVRLLRRSVGRDPLPARLLARMWAESWQGLWAYPRSRAIADARRLAVVRDGFQPRPREVEA